MTTVSGTLTASGASSIFTNGPYADTITYDITGPFDGIVAIERATTPSESAWEAMVERTDASADVTGTFRINPGDKIRARLKNAPSNMITNGTFAAATGWTANAGWAIAAGVASATTASTALTRTVDQGLVAGASYLVTFTVANRSAGSVAVSLGGGTAGTSRSSDDTFAEVIVAGATQVLAFTGTGFTGDIDDVTVVPSIDYTFNDVGTILEEHKDLTGFPWVEVSETNVRFPSTVPDGTSQRNVSVDGDLTVTGGVIRTAQKRIINVGAKAGTTAGWVVGAANNLGLLATCPASQTASTLVVQVPGLKVGDTITAFSVVGQIESGGNTVTLDANLRKLTAAAADVTDASVGSITQISKTADYAIADEKTGLTEVVAANETFYVLLTATTAASTDIALQGITVTVTEA